MHRQIIRDDEERRRMYEDREVMRDQLNELRSKSVSPNPLQFFNFFLLTDSTFSSQISRLAAVQSPAAERSHRERGAAAASFQVFHRFAVEVVTGR